MSKQSQNPFKWRHFQADIILSYVRWYLRYSLSYRDLKDLNNLIEQDHRFVKRLTKPGMGFFSFETAWRTLQGFEIMNMLRKGQMHGVAKGDVGGQVALIARLFGVAVQPQQGKALPPHFASFQFLATQP